MTRWQQWVLATLSLLATGIVLIEGGRGTLDGALDAVRASAPVSHTVTSPLLAGAPAADDDAGSSSEDLADESGDDSGDADDTVSDLGASEDTATAEEPAAEEQPATGDDAASEDDATGDDSDAAAPEEEPAKPTKVKHVFVISLAGHGFDAHFGAGSQAPYLSGRLRPQGVLLEGATALAADGLPDRLAQIGGQPPNAQTQAGCPTFAEIPPSATVSKRGEVTADGCVFPNTVTTIGDQLTSRGLLWRAYVEDLDKGPDRRRTCRRPGSNAADDTLRGRVGDSYATRLNPWVYYHSLLDLGDCDANDGTLDRLGDDLAKASATPNLSWIAPNLCNSGSESPCADGSPGGLAAADAFLATWVPKILASPAYREDGLLFISFAGRVSATAGDDLRNGALLISRFALPGTTAGATYDPYSLLRSIEDLFALRPLARAATASSFAPTALAAAYVEPPSDG